MSEPTTVAVLTAAMVPRAPKGRPYVLRGWEVGWLSRKADSPAEHLVRSYLRARTRRNGPDPSTNSAVRITNLLRANAKELKSQVPLHLLQSALGMSESEPSDLYLAFRDLWRRYTDEELTQETVAVGRELRETRQTLDRQQRRSRRLRDAAARRRHRGKQAAFDEALAVFTSIQAEIGSLDPAAVARSRLRERHPGPWSSWLGLLMPPDPLQMARRQLAIREALDAAFPLRFLVGQPLDQWLDLHEAWREGASRSQLLAMVEATAPVETVIEDINRLSRSAASQGLADRSSELSELRTTWNSSAFLACTLVAVTQLEGVLWDVAHRMNARNWRIYHRYRGSDGRWHYKAYFWDFTRRRYKWKAPRVVERGTRDVTSVRQLLSQTRLGTLVPIELFSFLVDEYYDDRNAMAHGDTATKDYREDAYAALLCLRAVYEDGVVSSLSG
jgi:hypothetical protein